VEAFVAAEELGAEVKERGDALGSGQRRDQQRVGTEGRGDAKAAVRLREALRAASLGSPAVDTAAVGGRGGLAHRSLDRAGRVLIQGLLPTGARRCRPSSCCYLSGSSPLPSAAPRPRGQRRGWIRDSRRRSSGLIDAPGGDGAGPLGLI